MLSQLLFDIDPSLFLPHSCLPDIEHWKNMLPVKSDKEAMLGAGHQIRKTSCGKKGNMLERKCSDSMLTIIVLLLTLS